MVYRGELTIDCDGVVQYFPENRKLRDENCIVGCEVGYKYPRFGSAVIFGVDPVDKRLIKVRWDLSGTESDWMYRDDFYMLQTV